MLRLSKDGYLVRVLVDLPPCCCFAVTGVGVCNADFVGPYVGATMLTLWIFSTGKSLCTIFWTVTFLAGPLRVDSPALFSVSAKGLPHMFLPVEMVEFWFADAFVFFRSCGKDPLELYFCSIPASRSTQEL